MKNTSKVAKTRAVRFLRYLKILTFIDKYVTLNKFAPSVRDIMKACSISSTSVVRYMLLELVKSGYLYRRPRDARVMRLTATGAKLVGSPHREVDTSSACPCCGRLYEPSQKLLRATS